MSLPALKTVNGSLTIKSTSARLDCSQFIAAKELGKIKGEVICKCGPQSFHCTGTRWECRTSPEPANPLARKTELKRTTDLPVPMNATSSSGSSSLSNAMLGLVISIIIAAIFIIAGILFSFRKNAKATMCNLFARVKPQKNESRWPRHGAELSSGGLYDKTELSAAQLEFRELQTRERPGELVPNWGPGCDIHELHTWERLGELDSMAIMACPRINMHARI